MSERLNHLPALDGLRAIAVMSVVLYHLDVDWAVGGFLGVDLFFVISGFLITTLLLREHRATGRIALGSFWTRRFNRLVPPLVAMVAATIAATRFWGVPDQWAAVRWDAAAALGYVANWRFVFAEQSYFETLLGPSPLLHTWSLAVEEQWYFAWPLAMVGLVGVAARWRRGWAVAIAVVVGAAIASAIWMAVLYDVADPSRVYYGTDTRAQHLLVGAALAWVVHRWPVAATLGQTRPGAVAVVIAIGTFLALAALTPDEAGWLYRGGFLAISIVCALLVLGTATPDVAGPLRWLTNPAVLWIGVRSYALYLWHWPVIVFVGEPMGIEPPRVVLALLQVGVSLLLADASYRLIERRTRTTRRPAAVIIGSWSVLAGAAVLAALVVLPSRERPDIEGGVLLTPDGPTSIDPASDDDRSTTAPTSSSTPTDTAPTVTDPAVTAPTDTAPAVTDPAVTAPTVTGVESSPPAVLLLGDSTAFDLAFDRPPGVSGPWDVYMYARLGCGIYDDRTVDSDSDRPNPRPDECTDWRTSWSRVVDEVDPDVVVVMVGAWEVLDQRIGDRTYRHPETAWSDLLEAQFSEALDIAGSSGAPVGVMSVPCMGRSGDENTTARTDPNRVLAVNTIIERVAAETTNVTVLDLDSLLCPGGTELEVVDGETVRSDGVHVTEAGSALVWRWLVPQLDALEDR
jgi:peptidoglycan/LPS O-acetylase OafA/YrhL